MLKNKKLTIQLLMLVAVIFWGVSWVNLKIVTTYINEFEALFFRFFISTILLFPILIYRKESLKLGKKNFLILFFSSLLMIGYLKYVFLGTQLGTASLASTLSSVLIPIFTFIFLWIMGKNSISKKQVFALALGTFGVALILNIWTIPLQEILVPYNLYLFLASMLWAILAIIKGYSEISPLLFTFYLSLFITILDVLFFIDIFAIEYAKFDYIFWLNISLLSLVATTFANLIYFMAVEKIGVNKASSFMFLEPFIAIFSSIIFLGEKITFSLILGTILTIVAVKFLND
jgi:drug/metabolite transporter (DMT)-like permease